MTTPNTPGDAIARAAARHKATVEATKALAEDIAKTRQVASEAQPPAEETTTP